MVNLKGTWAGASVLGMLAMLTCLHCGGDGGGSDAKGSSGAAGEPNGEGGSAAGGGTGTSGAPGGAGAPAGEAGAGAAPAVAGAPAGGAGAEGGAGGAGGEAPVVVTGDHYGFVMKSLTVPTTSGQSRMLAFDVDGNGTVENRYGDSMVTLALQGFDSNARLSALINNGTTITLFDLQAPSLSTADGAGFVSYLGSDPQPSPCKAANDCGYHLNGEGSFIATGVAGTEAAVGTITDGVFTGKGGTLPLMVGIGGGLTLLLDHAQVELSELSDTGFDSGRIGGALSQAEIDGKLFPGVHLMLTAALDRDCTGAAPPGCGCASGSTGKTYVDMLDANDDCDISLAELKSNAIIKSLFAPDLDLDKDGTKESLSCAFATTGAKATFVLP